MNTHTQHVQNITDIKRKDLRPIEVVTLQLTTIPHMSIRLDYNTFDTKELFLQHWQLKDTINWTNSRLYKNINVGYNNFVTELHTELLNLSDKQSVSSMAMLCEIFNELKTRTMGSASYAVKYTTETTAGLSVFFESDPTTQSVKMTLNTLKLIDEL